MMVRQGSPASELGNTQALQIHRFGNSSCVHNRRPWATRPGRISAPAKAASAELGSGNADPLRTAPVLSPRPGLDTADFPFPRRTKTLV